jgi:protein involved in polysaccharide export with SLBB domain
MLWCMHRTNIYLTEEQERALDAVARAGGITRSEVIRLILDRHLRSGLADAIEAALAAVIDDVDRALDTVFVGDDDLAVR